MLYVIPYRTMKKKIVPYAICDTLLCNEKKNDNNSCPSFKKKKKKWGDSTQVKQHNWANLATDFEHNANNNVPFIYFLLGHPKVKCKHYCRNGPGRV